MYLHVCHNGSNMGEPLDAPLCKFVQAFKESDTASITPQGIVSYRFLPVTAGLLPLILPFPCTRYKCYKGPWNSIPKVTFCNENNDNFSTFVCLFVGMVTLFLPSKLFKFVDNWNIAKMSN